MKTSYLPTPAAPVTTIIGLKDIGPYYWVGHCLNGIHYYAGQTFKSTSTGRLKSIKIFTSIVYGNSNARLSLYEFDQANHIWKEKKADAYRYITKAMEGEWVNFEFKINLMKDVNYAFRISAEGGGMVAVAECTWTKMNPYADGEEWIGSSIKQEGYFHKDFDLAFEAEIEA